MAAVKIADDAAHAGVPPGGEGPGPAASPGPALTIHARDDAGRRTVEHFVEQAHARLYGGTLTEHYPVIVSIRSDEGRILAAAGVRFAGESLLWAEQQLSLPIEREIARLVGKLAPRRRIAEVGDFTWADDGSALRLLAGLSGYLPSQGCDYVVATATAATQRWLRRAGFDVDVLAQARADRLLDAGASGGRYYEHRPAVVLGKLRTAADQAHEQPSTAGQARRKRAASW